MSSASPRLVKNSPRVTSASGEDFWLRRSKGVEFSAGGGYPTDRREDISKQTSGETDGGLALYLKPVNDDDDVPKRRTRQLRSVLENHRLRETPPVPLCFRTVGQCGLELEPQQEETISDAPYFPKFATLPPLHLKPSKTSNTPSTGGPLRIGIIFAGQHTIAAGVNNVVVGIHAYVSAAAPGSTLLGFRGPMAFLEGKGRELASEEISMVLNQGGGDLIEYGTCSGEGFAKADRQGDVQKANAICKSLVLDTLIVIGGPRDMSWAAAIADGLSSLECDTTVVAVPQSKNLNFFVGGYMPITLGFDSAWRTLCEYVGNIAVDSMSSKKYWHFIRCGDDALTLEATLQTRATYTLIRRDIHENRMGFNDVVNQIVEIIGRRRQSGRFSGIVLLSDGLIHSLPEFEALQAEVRQILQESGGRAPAPAEVENALSPSCKDLFKRFPKSIRSSFLANTDAAGLPQLPEQLEAERILGRAVQQALVRRKLKGKFTPRFHHFGKECSVPMPSNFDCSYGYTLGHVAGALAHHKKTFYVACVGKMDLPVKDWQPCAIPFSKLYGADSDPQTLEIPKTGWRDRPRLFEAFRDLRDQWVENSQFKAIGPLQFGDSAETEATEKSVALLSDYLSLEELKKVIQPYSTMQEAAVVSTEPLVVLQKREIENLSCLEQRRLLYQPSFPGYLMNSPKIQEANVTARASTQRQAFADAFPCTHALNAIRIILQQAPATSASGPRSPVPGQCTPGACAPVIGVVFTGSQAPGFHSVVSGLFDYVQTFKSSTEPELIGILGGYSGLMKGHTRKIRRKDVDQHRNLGGHYMLCTYGEPVHLERKADLDECVQFIERMNLDGLVLVGNLDCHLDSAVLTETCAAKGIATTIVGVPASTESDMPFVQQTLGYDTVCRVFSSIVGSLACEAWTTGDKWIFVRIKGHALSHIAIECALQTHPNMVLIPEEIVDAQRSLADITKRIADQIVARGRLCGRKFGTILIPEGILEHLPEMRRMFSEIEEIQHSTEFEPSYDSIPDIISRLKPGTASIFEIIPREVQFEVCFGMREKASEGVDLSNISSERLILRMVEIEMDRRTRLGLYQGEFKGFASNSLAYQARSALPTNFDCDLAYTLGIGAGILVNECKSGYLVHVSGLQHSTDAWSVGGIPFTALLKAKEDGKGVTAIQAQSSQLLLTGMDRLRPFIKMPVPVEREPLCPGPVQFWGACAEYIGARISWHLVNMPDLDPTEQLHQIATYCGELQAIAASAKNPNVLVTAKKLLSSALSVLQAWTDEEHLAQPALGKLAQSPTHTVKSRAETPTRRSGRNPAWLKDSSGSSDIPGELLLQREKTDSKGTLFLRACSSHYGSSG